MGCEDGDGSVATGIDIVPLFSAACRTTTLHPSQRVPLAVELGSDHSTSGNDGAPSMLPRTVPLSFINDPEASFILHIHERLST